MHLQLCVLSVLISPDFTWKLIGNSLFRQLNTKLIEDIHYITIKYLKTNG